MVTIHLSNKRRINYIIIYEIIVIMNENAMECIIVLRIALPLKYIGAMLYDKIHIIMLNIAQGQYTYVII